MYESSFNKKRQNIIDFVKTNSEGKVSFEDWLVKLKYADWKVPMDIKSTYKTADILGRSSNRVIFNIGGNYYRMICKFAFGNSEVYLFVCWIGTHASYDELCMKNLQYTINTF